MQDALIRAEHIQPWLVDVRRTLHRFPELAFAEVRTSTTLRHEIEALGLPLKIIAQGTGIVARLQGTQNGPTVALRADMDALPGKEITGLPFSSENPGVVHACGHDAHMTMVLGAAALLAQDPPEGNVAFIFQPAEERGQGARTMIQGGALDNVEAIYAGHVSHSYPTGQMMVTTGAITSQSDRFRVHVEGKAGHSARPHEAIDAVSIAGFLIHAVHTLSRRLNPLHPSVVSVNKVEAGTAANVIAGEAFLEGSIRTSTPETRRHIHDGLRRIARAAGVMHDARVNIEIGEGNPPVINSDREVGIARGAVAEVLGPQALISVEPPSLGSEDFSLYLEEVPGCYVRIGARKEDWDYVPLHSPAFTIDEDALKVGAAFFDCLARRALETYAG